MLIKIILNMEGGYKVVYNASDNEFRLSNIAINWLEEHAMDKSLKDFLANERVVVSNEKWLWSTTEDRMAYALLNKYNGSGIPRHHNDLVAVVEELGDLASGTYSKLVIKKIGGPLYRIELHCDKEVVVEPKDIEWIKITND